MNLNGSLDAFGLPDVFSLLAMTGKSGGLRLHRVCDERRVDGIVWFHDGRVTGASADCSRLGLVRRLVGSGALDDAALHAAVGRAESSLVGVARALLEAGAVEPELVREAAVDQAVDAVFDLTRWGTGEFGFDPGARNVDDVGIALEHTWLIAEAAARRATWDELCEVIPAGAGAVTMPVVLDDDPQVTRQEWSLLALVDGRRSVQDLVELTGCGEFAVVTVLAGLARRGLLTVLAPGGADHITTVERRLALLAQTEDRNGGPAAAPEPEPVAEPAVAEATEPAATRSAEPVTRTRPAAGAMTASEALAAARAAQGLAPGRSAERPAARREVVPPRPEPFLPERTVDHPETVARAAAASTGPGPVVGPPAGSRMPPMSGNTAMVPAEPATVGGAVPAGLIERDPSVNRSLLLRLIAGVRGL